MHTIRLLGRGDFSEWRDAARMLASAGISPREADWRICGLEEELFEAAAPPQVPALDPVAPPLAVPPAFLSLAEAVVCHT
jgi:uracil-DNA glycosylase